MTRTSLKTITCVDKWWLCDGRIDRCFRCHNEKSGGDGYHEKIFLVTNSPTKLHQITKFEKM